MNPNINYRPQLLLAYQYWFTNYTTCATIQDVNSKGIYYTSTKFSVTTLRKLLFYLISEAEFYHAAYVSQAGLKLVMLLP
jgi:hypothetical protein